MLSSWGRLSEGERLFAFLVVSTNLFSAGITITIGAPFIAFLFQNLESALPLLHRNQVRYDDRFLLPQQALCCECPWAFVETFNGLSPSIPSQSLLPKSFDYVATHRSHPKDHFTKVYASYPADHDSLTCDAIPTTTTTTTITTAGAPQQQSLLRLAHHNVTTSNKSNGVDPDPSFFICKNHMMSSMGDVDGYSVTSFWPRQEFQFSGSNNNNNNDNNNNNIGGGGTTSTFATRTLAFEVSIALGHTSRSWWEILLTPRSEMKVGTANPFLPISETYPKDHIVCVFQEGKRSIRIGTNVLAPEGWIVDETQVWHWNDIYPNDAALYDGRIRRNMKLQFKTYPPPTTGASAVSTDVITWSIEKEDGTMDDWQVQIPNGGFPFHQGLVLFKTHAYTPNKEGNFDTFTFHWDNIRFDGPIVGKYKVYEANDVVYLENNGNRPIGDQQEVFIVLPSNTLGPNSNPVLFGQVHSPFRGQVLLSINGADTIIVNPYDYENNEDCESQGWKSFRLELQPTQLRAGQKNTFLWTVGPRPSCVQDWMWDGFSIKFLQIQVDDNS